MRKKLVLKVEDGDDSIRSSYNSTPSMKKAEEDRNKVIPNYVMEAIKNAFPQKKLSNFFEPLQIRREGNLEAQVVDVQKQPDLATKVSEPLSVQDSLSSPAVEKIIGNAAVSISRELKANLIVTLEKGSSETSEFNFEDVKVVIFRQVKSTYQRYVSYTTKMRKQPVGSVLPVKELLMEAVNRKYIGKGDKIIFIGGDSIGTWLKGFFFVLDVDKVFFNISTHNLTQTVSADILEAVINLAQEIGVEGREGRSIGTAFVIGKKDELLRHTKPLLRINPFGNLPDEAKRITDPEMKETVKNLAQLDGVFLVDESGSILNAGAYINIDQANLDLPGLQGFGTRHRCTAALTKMTDTIGVVVSASGGTIRIFKEGKQIMKLP
ncbi:DNA integrity scanning protein DisA nucleotide-binding domain protein [Candidatus Woesearchaeota archaeon]|nr:DNA integrity scanning protein DisA nucleotide-binding domain protein [Candidatus Woesearchaeota archaeon]